MNKLHVKDYAYIGMFAALITISSWISIPLTVPVTLQTFGVALAVLLLGTKRGLLSFLVFLALGVCGVPVFSGFKSGIGAVLGPTGGFLIGFILFIIIAGIFRQKKSILQYSGLLIALITLYAFGSLWYQFVYLDAVGFSGYKAVLLVTVVPFIVPDVCKILLAVFLNKRLAKFIN